MLRNFALICLLCFPAIVRAQVLPLPPLEIVAEGQAALDGDLAAALDNALWDAQRVAVERAVGIWVSAKSVGSDFALEDDRIEARTGGYIKTWERLDEPPRIETLGNGKILHVKIHATVGRLPEIRRLSDIRGVYDDLDRPRISVEITGDTAASAAQTALVAELKAQGLDVATDGMAEIRLVGTVTTNPTVRMGDDSAPYRVGECVAAGRAKLRLTAKSAVSEEVLVSVETEGAGSSFDSDEAARREAVGNAAQSALDLTTGKLLPDLLVLWARERQEGHVITLKIKRLPPDAEDALVRSLAAMRGTRKIVGTAENKQTTTVRFVTRLANRDVRRRLAQMRFNAMPLVITNERGAIVTCAAQRPSRLTRR